MDKASLIAAAAGPTRCFLFGWALGGVAAVARSLRPGAALPGGGILFLPPYALGSTLAAMCALWHGGRVVLYLLRVPEDLRVAAAGVIATAAGAWCRPHLLGIESELHASVLLLALRPMAGASSEVDPAEEALPAVDGARRLAVGVTAEVDRAQSTPPPVRAVRPWLLACSSRLCSRLSSKLSSKLPSEPASELSSELPPLLIASAATWTLLNIHTRNSGPRLPPSAAAWLSGLESSTGVLLPRLSRTLDANSCASEPHALAPTRNPAALPLIRAAIAGGTSGATNQLIASLPPRLLALSAAAKQAARADTAIKAAGAEQTAETGCSHLQEGRSDLQEEEAELQGGGHWVGQGGGRRADHLLRQGGGYPLRPAIIAFAGSTREALGSAVLSGVCVIALGSGRTSRYGWAPGVLALLCLTPPHRRLLASRLGYMASLATLRLACGGAPHRVFGSLTLAWSSARLLLSYRRTAAAVAAGAARRETCARAAAGSGGVVCASGGQPSTRAGRGGGSFSARMMSVEGHRCLHFLLGYDDGRFVFDTSQRQRATT